MDEQSNEIARRQDLTSDEKVLRSGVDESPSYYSWDHYFCNWVSIAIAVLALFASAFPKRLPMWLLWTAEAGMFVISVAGLMALRSFFFSLGSERTEHDTNWIALAAVSHMLPFFLGLYIWYFRNDWFVDTNASPITVMAGGFALFLYLVVPYLYFRGEKVFQVYWFVDLYAVIPIGLVVYGVSLAGVAVIHDRFPQGEILRPRRTQLLTQRNF